jgi:hypothetical protein
MATGLSSFAPAGKVYAVVYIDPHGRVPVSMQDAQAELEDRVVIWHVKVRLGKVPMKVFEFVCVIIGGDPVVNGHDEPAAEVIGGRIVDEDGKISEAEVGEDDESVEV